MTQLAEKLEGAGDTVFTVNFRKKVDSSHVEDQLLSVSAKELSDQKYLSNFVKSVVEGDECTITGHLVDCENSLGRSTVIDL